MNTSIQSALLTQMGLVRLMLNETERMNSEIPPTNPLYSKNLKRVEEFKNELAELNSRYAQSKDPVALYSSRVIEIAKHKFTEINVEAEIAALKKQCDRGQLQQAIAGAIMDAQEIAAEQLAKVAALQGYSHR